MAWMFIFNISFEGSSVFFCTKLSSYIGLLCELKRGYFLCSQDDYRGQTGSFFFFNCH